MKPVLIIGGGPPGHSAAHALAAAGHKVVLVEKEDRLGGAPILSGYAKLVPSHEWARDAIGGMVTRVHPHPDVDVRLNTVVQKFEGTTGDFTATLKDGSTVTAGAAILATGFTHFDSINKPEWGFGTYPDVVTTVQVEQMISSGKGILCPSDGRVPDRVAILLCVGSRDRQIGREWCSKICCTVSANIAMEIRELSPKTNVYIYYMDIRTFGLLEGEYYWKSQEEAKVKYIKARIAEVARCRRSSGADQSNSSSTSTVTRNRVPNAAGQPIRSAALGASGRQGRAGTDTVSASTPALRADPRPLAGSRPQPSPGR